MQSLVVSVVIHTGKVRSVCCYLFFFDILTYWNID